MNPTPKITFTEGAIGAKRARTATPKMAEMHQASQSKTDSILFDSFSFAAAAPLKVSKSQARSKATGAVTSQQRASSQRVTGNKSQSHQQQKAVPAKSVKKTVKPALSTAARRRLEDSQATEMDLSDREDDDCVSYNSEDNHHHGQDDSDNGSTTSCFTFDESYMTEPLFYA